ncbi:GNAT family N-acetyltransferase [Pararhodobacter sp.]|uniref:GNAT family N-acetyltransferase n=1 Tax=Pararhodobacter sp. TaxID=2127056 RepID=UPI002AFFAF1D|nr:GNAT family N-acetyltransferase [Pararhodobacter sp.]
MPAFPLTLPLPDGRLRPLVPGDLPALIAQLSDPMVAPWLAAVPQPFTPVEAEALLALAEDPAEGVRVLELDGEPRGCLRIAPALWYWLAPSLGGRGIMTRTLGAAIAAHVAGGGAPLVATVREGNAASEALLLRLGFSRAPRGRRMFFQATGRAEPCRDFHLTPEQWLVLNPPLRESGDFRLRPATARDAGLMALMLPRPGSAGAVPWPRAEGIADFLETHRCRRPSTGLFVIEYDTRRSLGLVLLGRETALLVHPSLAGTAQETALRQAVAGLGPSDEAGCNG